MVTPLAPPGVAAEWGSVGCWGGLARSRHSRLEEPGSAKVGYGMR